MRTLDEMKEKQFKRKNNKPKRKLSEDCYFSFIKWLNQFQLINSIHQHTMALKKHPLSPNESNIQTETGRRTKPHF